MSNTAFICPLYDMKNHFDLAINLYKSKIEFKIDADLIFVFSNEEQKDTFALRVKNELGIENMLYSIMPEELLKYQAKAVTKKLYGLKEFMNQYDYIILTDCEAVFVRNFDADAVAKEIWDSRSMLASNISPNGFLVMRRCYKTMGLYYNKKLRKELGGFRYNFWFNEMQVYKCSYLPDFFNWLNNFDMEKIYNTWHCFEYYVFYAYLCLEHDIHIIKHRYICLGGINECLNIFNIKKQQRVLKDLKVHWTTSREIQSEEICMLFHLDRTQNYYRSKDISNGIIHKYTFIIYKKIKLLLREIMFFLKKYCILLLEIPEYLQEMRNQ